MPKTTTVKSILNKSKQRDQWFLDDYTVNLYSSCSFNCLYCYIRGSKYGTHLEKSVTIKSNALELLDRQLHNRAKKGEQGFVVFSSVTDPYLHLEEKEQRMREALKLLIKYKFPVHILTKSTLVQRDFDLLQELESVALIPRDLQARLKKGVLVTYSFSTLDADVARIFEPGAPHPADRLELLKLTRKEGFLSGVSFMPLLPYISDTAANLERSFETFKTADARYVFPATLTLFGEGSSASKTLTLNAIKKHYPHLLEKYEKFFLTSNEMPAYYRDAFEAKMYELRAKHQIPNYIAHESE